MLFAWDNPILRCVLRKEQEPRGRAQWLERRHLP